MNRHGLYHPIADMRETQISNFLKILQILYGYHKFTSGLRPMSNLLTVKEVNYESIHSIKNLARLSPNQFEKKIHIDAIR